MSDLEQSVFRVINRYPFCGAVLVAYKLGIPQVEVQAAMERLAERGILQNDERNSNYTKSAANI